MPGVLIVEAIAQAGGALLLTEVEDRSDKVMVFTGIERAKFRRPVSPGDQLRIEVEVKGWRVDPAHDRGENAWRRLVAGKRVAEATVSCQLIDSSRGRGDGCGWRPAMARLRNEARAPACSRTSSPSPDDAITQSMNVHPTAIIDPRAKVPASCKVGPYCVIGADVELGEDCRSGVACGASKGRRKSAPTTRFFPFCAIGMAPQDVTYKGEPTRLEIGDHNEIRECVTISRGTVKGGGLTRVGSHTLIMAYAHIGHDSVIGDHCMLVNGATLGGHVTVEEWAVVGALCPVHQFVRIGAHAYIGGGTTITQDVLPFSMTSAARNTHAYGMNKVGLERRGFSQERIRKIHHAYKTLLASKMNTSQALEKLKSEPDRGEDVDMLIRFHRSIGARSD